MRQAVIISTARPPTTKTYRWARNNLMRPHLAIHTVQAAGLTVSGSEAAVDRQSISDLSAASIAANQGLNMALAGELFEVL